MSADPGTGDLKKSKAELLRAAAKLLGVLTLALVPSLVGWIDAKAKATSALAATASEAATNDKAYEKLVDRLNRTEDDLRKMTVELAVLRELARDARDTRDARRSPPLARVSTSTTGLAEHSRSPVPKLSSSRPTATPEEVNAAQVAFEAKF